MQTEMLHTTCFLSSVRTPSVLHLVVCTFCDTGATCINTCHASVQRTHANNTRNSAVDDKLHDLCNMQHVTDALKHAPPCMCYHAESGHFRLNHVFISRWTPKLSFGMKGMADLQYLYTRRSILTNSNTDSGSDVITIFQHVTHRKSALNHLKDWRWTQKVDDRFRWNF